MNSQNRGAVEGSRSATSDEAKKANAEMTSPTKPSVVSSAGAIGKNFNPDGAIGSIGQSIGGPLSKDGVIGSQFDASKGGIAGGVESLVGGPKAGGSK